MVELHVRLPEDLFQQLQREADSRKIPLEEMVLAAIRQCLGIPGEQEPPQAGRLERFVRESGLFAPPHRKLSPELEKLAREVPPDERERLAEALSRGKSLSEMIIEDRG